MLEALAQFRAAAGSGVLWLVGDGPKRYQQSLVKLARNLRIEDHVVFWGHVPAADKHRLMAQADALLMTSIREGWGLVVTEANACGTPAIVYDVPGLRDSVLNESTGLVVPPSPRNLSAAMLRMTADPALRSRLAAQAKTWSSTFSYDKAAILVEHALVGTRVA
jgi:glycosyltransferase involved in cell wall biosynthesis